jgi:hypothetical protein
MKGIGSGQRHIFLLIGQSNMAGRGRLDEVPPLRHPDVFMFRDGRWFAAEEPLHTDKPQVAGVGLGMSFAVELIQRAGLAPIGLLPCAVGGTPLSRWMPGADLYLDAVRITRAALDGGSLAGILWHQGEADACNLEDATRYAERFSVMIRALRGEFSAPDIPVIVGELGPFLRQFEACGHYEQVNRQLHDLERLVPALACVSAEGLGHNGDYLHFSAAALREFGVRYAAALCDRRVGDMRA